MDLSRFSTEKYRWWALLFLALGLAIVIIDTTVLNVAVPYILRDLKTSLDAIQWVISGYSLIIATLLITVGRLGDLFGRKKIFLIGIVLFMIGSYFASISQTAVTLFVGEALIEAIGASMMMTSSLALLVSEFEGRERAIAFGIWGSVAGASAAFGPLLGGYLTTYFSWRWSLRINVIVGLVTILGSIFIREAKGRSVEHFDWAGTFYSGFGLFSFVFGLIEGNRYGWFRPHEQFVLGSWVWPFTQISIIPFVFILAAILLAKFVHVEYKLEKKGHSPLLKLSMFKVKGFSIGLAALGIMALGQFATFFVLIIFLQNVLGLNAFNAGRTFLWMSLTMFIVGPTSGFIASKVNPKYVVNVGMFILAFALFILVRSANLTATSLSLAPALVLMGIGGGMSMTQLTNIILSAVPTYYAGEASAVNTTVRQVGTSIGIAITGTVLTATLFTGLPLAIQNDTAIPPVTKVNFTKQLKGISIERPQIKSYKGLSPALNTRIKKDVSGVFVQAVQRSLTASFVFVFLGAVLALFIPRVSLKPKESPEIV